MKFTVDIHTRRVDYPRFRQVYFSEQFNREIVRAVNLQERTTTEHVIARDGKERMRVRIVPKVALPGMILKLLENNPISYDEITVFDPATRRASFAIETPAGEIVQVTGQAHLLDDGDGVRLRFEGDARVRLLGVGGMIERFLVKEVTERYAQVERALQHFIDQGRDLGLPGGSGTSGHG